MLSIDQFYLLLAAFLAYAGWRNLRQNRYSHAAFWGLIALLFAGGGHVLRASKAGDALPAQLAGAAVIALALLATRMRREPQDEAPESERLASALRLGHRLFLPALLIPALTILVVLAGPHVSLGGTPLFASAGLTLTGLALACTVSALAAVVVTRQRPLRAADEGRRLLDTLGWAALLPLVLATLGGVFAASGVGEAVASLVSMVIPADNRMACLLAFALGMVVFTVIMGNAFAAFPVMMAGIGLPLLVQRHGADAASLGAIGMLTGYCGTLLTPMAANFNIVPAVLLGLDDQYGVIRAQAATGLWLMGTNVLLMAWLCFR
ncbi:DUF979 domain-containing protein [Pseudoxanthomonas sp. PXM03]|uniref:5-oxoproline transporter, DUF979 family subunit n=1 Tax=Pseudoxanthomonas sp. PXM03 TaxID=2769284 RepID=UPI00177F297C|nr:DUF979 family protein [Pseudoxanthomonas sp. PXM03]MBD9436327.1 DUF979 domain-containing protein [Pseudoxanthomonas sp. PXM03]